MAARLYLELTIRGYRCWYDQQFKGNLNRERMKEGVQDSLCYILLLTANVFSSEAVLFELNNALDFGKHILLLHDPNTGQKDHCEFNDYKERAPDRFRSYFNSVHSMPFFLPHYLMSGVMLEVETRIAEFQDQNKKLCKGKEEEHQ